MTTKAKAPAGVFEFYGDKIASYRPFSRDPEKAAEEFLSEKAESGKILRKKMRGHAISSGFVSSTQEFNRFISEFAAALSRKKMHGMIGRDRLVIHAGNSLESLDKTFNMFLERFGEWYSLHYPESRESARELLEKALKYGNRKNFPGFKESSGVELSGDDEKIILEYAVLIKSLNETKRDMEKYIAGAMKEIAPNTASIIEPLLGARMLAIAGSLEKLARMSASSIQLMGAEKALFRHIKNRASPRNTASCFWTREYRMPRKKTAAKQHGSLRQSSCSQPV